MQRIDRVHSPWIYMVQFGEGTPIKLGTTTDIGSRLTQIEIYHYNRMTVLYTQSGGFAVESELKKRFAADRLRGEWFRPSSELLTYCDREMRKENVHCLLNSIEWGKLLDRRDSYMGVNSQ